MADECQLFDGIWSHPELKELKADKLIKFANLVAAIEREVCAKICESVEMFCDEYDPCYGADMIRARGNNDV